ncbi:conjugal transfer protein TrbH [Ensifer sp. Root31]|uniref:conjugal transfer protein TrbH n=1 Tax=Ensifer sp. Root31 TaxID=1736512 RepID=UPI00070AA111|nr:conjugal transfer protein TrbH [Ensifer sp. Root31]KQU89495.1 conjugal transfer protein TrbH [Ensifer sp. Root31]
MRKLPTFVFTVGLLTSCQTGDEAFTTDSTSTSVTGPAASAIAGDMASRFAEQIGSPATTTIKLDKGETEYAIALEAALTGWGYTVTSESKTTKKERAVALTYAIDTFDGHVLARLTIPSLAIARAYTQTASGATPASPLSVLRHN